MPDRSILRDRTGEIIEPPVSDELSEEIGQLKSDPAIPEWQREWYAREEAEAAERRAQKGAHAQG